MPPWLWLWLIGDLAVLIPAEISNERHQIALYTGHGEIAPQVTAGVPDTLLLLVAENGITADQKATAILTGQVEVCRR